VNGQPNPKNFYHERDLESPWPMLFTEIGIDNETWSEGYGFTVITWGQCAVGIMFGDFKPIHLHVGTTEEVVISLMDQFIQEVNDVINDLDSEPETQQEILDWVAETELIKVREK